MIGIQLAQLHGMRPSAARARERATIDSEEIRGSCRLAGASLEPNELSALLVRDVALGGRPFRTYAVVKAYAAATRLVERALERGPATLVRSQEIVELHVLATAYEDGAQPGAWRLTTAPVLRTGIVPPAFWLVPREIESFVRRFGRRAEGDPITVFIAGAHEAFARIHPFVTGNGRVNRLVVNLMLRRLGLPPLVIAPRQSAAYRAALNRADSGDLLPLATFIGRSLTASLSRLTATGSEDLRPLGHFGNPTPLYKAAQRNRLRTVKRGGSLLTTSRWIDDYRAARSRR